MKILVLGGNGFIGRNIVTRLKEHDVQVFISGRYVAERGKQIQLRLQNIQQAEDWLTIINGFDVIVNSVGILRERGYFSQRESYAAIHTASVKSLAEACAKLGTRLIHISALGLSPIAKSGFIRSKYWGEQAIKASGANAVIVRVSLLDGEGGYGAKWFRRMANWPIHFVMNSDGLIAPMQVDDLGEAVANLIMLSPNTPSIIELGGSDTLSIPKYLQQLRQSQGSQLKAVQLGMPKWLVRLVSHVFDVFAWTPLSFGHFELMQGVNVPELNSLPKLLGREPTKIGVVLKKQLIGTSVKAIKFAKINLDQPI